MEILQWVILSFAILLLVLALIVFLRHSVLGGILTNCCYLVCNAPDNRQDSHLDTYNLQSHYRRDCEVERGLSNPGYTGDNRDSQPGREVVLTPLPNSLRSQCPSGSCILTHAEWCAKQVWFPQLRYPLESLDPLLTTTPVLRPRMSRTVFTLRRMFCHSFFECLSFLDSNS